MTTLEGLASNVLSALTNKTSMQQIDQEMISSHLPSIKNSVKDFVDATRLLQDPFMTTNEAIKAIDKSTDDFYANKERLITKGLNELKEIEGKGSTGDEERLHLLAENFNAKYIELQEFAHNMTQCIMDGMDDAGIYYVGMDDVGMDD